MPTPQQRFYLARHRRQENFRQLQHVRPHPDKGDNQVDSKETRINPMTKMWRRCPRCIRIPLAVIWLSIVNTEYIFAVVRTLTATMALFWTPFMIFRLSELFIEDSVSIGNFKYMFVVIFCCMGLMLIKGILYVLYESIKNIIEITDWKNI